RVAVGHAERSRLVAGRVEHPAGGDDRVRHGQVAAAHQAEHDVGAEAVQRAAGELGDEHATEVNEPGACRTPRYNVEPMRTAARWAFLGAATALVALGLDVAGLPSP